MTTMVFIAGIIGGTPLWVWGLLALLLYLGYRATRSRTIDARRALILPLVMAAVSVSSMLTGPVSGPGFAAWIVALATGAAAGARLGLVSGATPGSAPMTIDMPGEWLSLVLIIAVFASRYAAAVVLALSPTLAADPGFIMIRSVVTGGLGGLFLGRGLAIAWLGLRGRRQAPRGMGVG